MIGDAFAQAMIACIIVVAATSAAVTALLIFGIPWLWAMVKPLLHAVTA